MNDTQKLLTGSQSVTLTCYAQEKSAGINCASFKCRFYDDTDIYDQRCSAGDSDDNPFLPYCNNYTPEY